MTTSEALLAAIKEQTEHLKAIRSHVSLLAGVAALAAIIAAASVFLRLR
jgi:precorrin-4 methylase